MKCDKNNRPFDNSTNGISYGLSRDSSYDLFRDSPRGIMIQTWNRHMRSLSDSLNGNIIELMHDSLNDTVNDSMNDSMNESMNNLMDDLMNDSLL